jgi:predicted RNA-binding protein with TRAM domain
VNQPNQTPPVKAGDELDVRIESVGEKGDGVAKKQGFVIFVPKAQKDQELHIRITKVLASVSFCENLGPARGPVVNPPREFGSREGRPRYQQPVKKEEVDLTQVGEGSEEF